jgi:23S rRNA U2552 (ribose-2'-O)-methylase RlmE/FtsJ
MEGWNKNCIDSLLQSSGNIVGYDTTCVSQGSISGIRVLINTIKLEPLHDQVILELDGTQVDVILQEIKGELIPSLTTVKHSMDVSLYTESVLSDDA